MDTYGQITSTTDTIKQARHCLERLADEVRESVNDPVVADPDPGLPALDPNIPIELQVRTVTDDALLLTSARQFVAVPDPDALGGEKDTTFVVDPNPGPGIYSPVSQSIILIYLNPNPDGSFQLMRHQLFYNEDLGAFDDPFVPVTWTDPDSDIVLADSSDPQKTVTIDRSTGIVGGVPPTIPPRVLMNRTQSFDLVDNGTEPLRIRITCQVIDRNNRAATTRLETVVEPRNRNN
jgi:hypothetical protein